MSVVGFDIGNLNTVIAVARNRGIDVICNEVSNRATPSLVSFGPKCRYLGEQAKTQEISNFKNTVGSLKRLIGNIYVVLIMEGPTTQELLDIERDFIGANLTLGTDGLVSANVQYMNEAHSFNYTQLFAMYLSKLKEITEAELKSAVTDVVISVPVYFTDAQRRALMDASRITGLNVLRLLNDVTAAALQWGITKELSETPRHVAFVDIGNSDFTVQITSFTKGKLQVKGCAYEKNFGGRNFDAALLDHFVEEFKNKYKMNVRENPKALFRLRSACERVKKILSANAQAPLNVECLMNDKDVSSVVERAQFEETVAPLMEKLDSVLQAALSQAGLTKDDIESVELIGGTTRIPSVKSRITSFFGKEPSTTLNQDECVAKGCAFMCAILSPVFKTREFKIEDICVHPIKFVYASSKDNEEMKELLAFGINSVVPSTKLLTFNRNDTFDVEAYQAERWIGKFSVKVSQAAPVDADPVVKVKVRINPDTCLDVGGAHVLVDAPASEQQTSPTQESATASGSDEKVESQETSENANPDKMEVDNAAPVVKKVKKDLHVTSANTSLQSKTVADLHSVELQMCASDKLLIETDNARNSLEEYIYDIRGKLESTHTEFATDQIREKLTGLCTEIEEWLYGEGEDATKSVYLEKLAALKKEGDPICSRYVEDEIVPGLKTSFDNSVVSLAQTVNGTAHLSDQDKSEAHKILSEKKYLADSLYQKDSQKKKCENKELSSEKIESIKKEMDKLVKAVLAKAKPPKPVEPKEATKEEEPLKEEAMDVAEDKAEANGHIEDVSMAEQ